MKTAILTSLLMISTSAMAVETQSATSAFKSASEIETSCRIKAKEIAAETYRGCVTDQKSSQIEQIKKEYAEKLNALKAHYDQELKKMSSQAKAKAEAQGADAAAKKAAKPATVAAKAKAKKAPEVVSKAVKTIDENSDMTVQLKPAPGEPVSDESILDLPEPIPVDESNVN